MKPVVPLLAAASALVVLAFGAARAGEGTQVYRPRQAPDSATVSFLVARIEASPGRCGRTASDDPRRRTLEADIGRLRRLVPAAARVRFDVLDCYWDGMVDRGRRIVLSARLARATPAQRFFVIAHEFGHFALGHHAALVDLVAELLWENDGDVDVVADAIDANVAGPLSRRHEFEADAFATRLTLQAGLDIEQAAAFFESQGHALKTHPGPRDRADAIRSLAARATAADALRDR